MTESKGYYDGKVGETYIAPATNRKGPREYPAWRDPDKAESNRRKCARLLKIYAFPLLLIIVAGVLFTFWALGYAAGYLDGYNGRPQRMESSHERVQ